jgi:hypothetical protein
MYVGKDIAIVGWNFNPRKEFRLSVSGNSTVRYFIFKNFLTFVYKLHKGGKRGGQFYNLVVFLPKCNKEKCHFCQNVTKKNAIFAKT